MDHEHDSKGHKRKREQILAQTRKRLLSMDGLMKEHGIILLDHCIY